MEDCYWLRDGLLHHGLPPFFQKLSDKRKHVIAIVGAGGKTTAIYKLSEMLQASGKRVAVTTTTHIYKPDGSVFCRNLEDCKIRWGSNSFAVWGRGLVNGKLGKLDNEEFSLLCEAADFVLVEADGAKRKACKVPAAHEPQIPEQADMVIGVLGLSVLGRTIKECCFRDEDVAAFLNTCTGHLLEPEDLAKIISSEKGTMKNVGKREYLALLNQCDNNVILEQGTEILRTLQKKNINGILCRLEKQQKPIYGGRQDG